MYGKAYQATRDQPRYVIVFIGIQYAYDLKVKKLSPTKCSLYYYINVVFKGDIYMLASNFNLIIKLKKINFISRISWEISVLFPGNREMKNPGFPGKRESGNPGLQSLPTCHH